MATATEISTKALRRAGIVNAAETPAAHDIAFCNDMLSSMIAAWDCNGLTGEVLPLASRFEEGVIAILAVKAAESFGVSVGPVLQRDADRGERQLLAHFVAIPNLRIDNALLSLPSNDYCRAIPVIDRVPEWDTSTAYGLGDRVFNGSYIYLCTTAGTSAASGGPASTSASISDGTVTWQFERVYGG